MKTMHEEREALERPEGRLPFRQTTNEKTSLLRQHFSGIRRAQIRCPAVSSVERGETMFNRWKFRLTGPRGKMHTTAGRRSNGKKPS